MLQGWRISVSSGMVSVPNFSINTIVSICRRRRFPRSRGEGLSISTSVSDWNHHNLRFAYGKTDDDHA